MSSGEGLRSSRAERLEAAQLTSSPSCPQPSGLRPPSLPPCRHSLFPVVDGEPGSDPTASIAMSVVSLAFCALGNALLIVRFSSNVPSVRALVVEAPLCAFWLKTAVEVVNLSLFGRIDTKPDNYSYGEGFWCAGACRLTSPCSSNRARRRQVDAAAHSPPHLSSDSPVFSCGLSGVVAMLLLLHFVVQRKQQWKDSIKIRVDGRHFMLSVLSFVSVIGIQALVYSKIEGWFYFDGSESYSTQRDRGSRCACAACRAEASLVRAASTCGLVADCMRHPPRVPPSLL